MCAGYRNSIVGRCIWGLALLALVGGRPLLAHVNPAGCSGSGIQAQLLPFACTGGTLSTCTVPIVGSGPVVAGQIIAYQATLAATGGTCAYQQGTYTLTLPNGSMVNVTDGADQPTNGGGCDTDGNNTIDQSSCGMSTTCIGCATLESPATLAATKFFAKKVLYTVNLSDASGGVITASVSYAGSVLHGSPNNSTGPTAGNSLPLDTQGCSATIDKQVSCDGGTTWYDAADGNNGGANDDAGNAGTKGCTAASGANVQIRFVAKNTGGAPISCTLSDNVFSIAGGGGVTIPTVASPVTKFVNPNPFACNLTGSDSGANTATLDSCTCETPQATPAVTGTGGTDTATYACCGVQFDKQISCDGGANYTDVSLDTGSQTVDDAANAAIKGCIASASATDPIRARYVAKNTGNVALTCSLGETNTKFLLSTQTGLSIPTGTTPAAIAGFTNPRDPNDTCVNVRSGGEPDTATLTCTCSPPTGVQNTTISAVNDTAKFECCGVKVDKRITCNNPPGGGSPVTVDDVCVPPDDGTNRCANLTGTGNTVKIGVFAQNIGTIDASCTLTDTATTGTAPITSISTPFIIPASQNTCSPLVVNSANVESTVPCDADQDDTVSLSCGCTSSGLTDLTLPAVSDTAGYTCSQPPPPPLVTKTCTPVQGQTGNFNLDVKVTNVSTTQISCTVVDDVFQGACPLGGSPTSATPPTVSLSPAPLIVAASSVQLCDQSTGTGCSSGDFTGQLTGQSATTCDRATVTCTPTGFPAFSPIVATATCPVAAGCFTRSPGFWGNHPNITQEVITDAGGVLNVCGVPINNVGTGAGSAIQDICSHPNDKKDTKPIKMSLIRSCMVAALNLAASSNQQNSPALDCNVAQPGIGALYDTCCNQLCPSGDTSLGGQTLESCQTTLDAFNNAFEATNCPSGSSCPPGASPGTCQQANGDKFVNPGPPGRYLPPKK